MIVRTTTRPISLPDPLNPLCRPGWDGTPRTGQTHMSNERDELFQLIIGRTTTRAVERILAAGYSKPQQITTDVPAAVSEDLERKVAELLYEHRDYVWQIQARDRDVAKALAALSAAGFGPVREAKVPEVRYATLTNGDTELDEVVASNAYVHLEAMDDNHWWLLVTAGGQSVHVNFYTKRAKISGHAEVEDAETT